MKKFLKVALVAAVLTALPMSSTFASKQKVNHQDPVAVVTAYFDAVKAGNVDTMMESAKDTRFSDEKAKRGQYEQDVMESPLKDYKILSTKQIDDSHMEFLVEANYSNSPKLPPLPYIAVKENGQWVLQIEQLDINMIQGSPDYGKVTVNKHQVQKENVTTHAVSPEATDMVYWNFSGLQKNVQILGNNTWQQVRTDGQLTISGWQDTGQTSPASMTYEVVSTSNNTTSIHSSVGVGNNYRQSGTWFTKYMTGVPNNLTLRMRFTNNSLYNTSGGGNGYN